MIKSRDAVERVHLRDNKIKKSHAAKFLVEMFESGRTISDVANAVGCSDEVIQRWIAGVCSAAGWGLERESMCSSLRDQKGRPKTKKLNCAGGAFHKDLAAWVRGLA